MQRLARIAAHRMETFAREAFVQGWRMHRQSEERQLTRLLADLQVDCVIDVGANVGQYARMLRDYCRYEGHIVSFEPTPSVFEKLQQNCLGDPKWRGYGFALGAECGKAVFHEDKKSSEGNSFLSWSEDPSRETVDTTVEIKTLRDVYPALKDELRIRRPFLKMDTQGFDLEVFAGAEGLHASMVGLQSELALVPYYEGAPDWLTALARYQDAGFVLNAFVPNNGISYPELREMDCIMYRPEFLGR